MAKKEQISLPGFVPTLPYSPVIRFGNTLYVAGQVGEDEDGNIPVTIGEQTSLAIENARKLIEAAGGSLDNVLMCRCFIRNPEDFNEMNEAYKKYFGGDHNVAPARYTVVAPPVYEKYLVEIAMIAGLEDE